jgi:hypothetical protein
VPCKSTGQDVGCAGAGAGCTGDGCCGYSGAAVAVGLAMVTVTVEVIVQDAEGARTTRALAPRPKAIRANAYFMLITCESMGVC